MSRITELEAKLANYESDAYVLSLLTKLDAVKSEVTNIDRAFYDRDSCSHEAHRLIRSIVSSLKTAIGEQVEVIDE